jgi:hypothetical protein
MFNTAGRLSDGALGVDGGLAAGRGALPVSSITCLTIVVISSLLGFVIFLIFALINSVSMDAFR